tara:strand:- start:1266 stop:1535 length:270 start_codon:yes stop_codon:yes gene_type:complete
MAKLKNMYNEVTIANNNTCFADSCKQLHRIIDEFKGPPAKSRKWRANLMQTEQSVREGLTPETEANSIVNVMIKEAAMHSKKETQMRRR